MSDHAYSPIPELNLLKELQARLGFECYSSGFGLTGYGVPGGLVVWSKDPEFLGGLISFAQANGSGSIYALWKVDDRTDLATLPVVVFGDEGGEHVVARNLRELFQLLGFNQEIDVSAEEAFFFRPDDDDDDDDDDELDEDDDYDPLAEHKEYVAWLDQHFGLPPADDPNAIVRAAQAEYGDRFTQWLRTYVPEPR